MLKFIANFCKGFLRSAEQGGDLPDQKAQLAIEWKLEEELLEQIREKLANLYNLERQQGYRITKWSLSIEVHQLAIKHKWSTLDVNGIWTVPVHWAENREVGEVEYSKVKIVQYKYRIIDINAGQWVTDEVHYRDGCVTFKSNNMHHMTVCGNFRVEEIQYAS